MKKAIIKFEHQEGKKFYVGKGGEVSYVIPSEGKEYHYFLINVETGELSPITSASDLDYYIKEDKCQVIDGDASINKIEYDK